eukprot:CAMPEP_0118978438 /NCGR_PEP_ID=MMETSP1173-20130426/23700_1 /TAXON_ID=1034831 /ORGANISM="Rhizochromulina marina cf, Strain CCMP1243" /LENGTH=363 /DNA_ID=CAMNT_0006928635 /DNA_START=90 /DNA_END=1178 /DNA_ORIENTATION=-
MSTAAGGPEDFLALADSFGVDPSAEPFLVPLLRQFFYTPLPPGWQRLSTLDGEHEGFLHGPSGERLTSHPARAFFERRLEDARRHQREAAPAEIGSSESWVELYGPTGESRFHDLCSGASRSSPAPHATTHPTGFDRDLPGHESPQASPVRGREWSQRESSAKFLGLAERWPWVSGSELPPENLVFRGWFQEASGARGELVRRELTLEYNCCRGEFVVQLSGSDKEYVLSHIPGKYGAVTELDLHVGAVLQLLGKPTELKQANLETSTWIQREASRLDKLEEGLLRSVRKYGVHSTHAAGGAQAAKVVFRSLPNPAGADLRQRHTDVERLYRVLQEIRPSDAETWRRKVSQRPRTTVRIQHRD